MKFEFCDRPIVEDPDLDERYGRDAHDRRQVDVGLLLFAQRLGLVDESGRGLLGLELLD